jgi:hypothetical protein
MIELIVAHPHVFWLSLGGLLLAAEMLGGNGYLLWSGIAAVITGLAVWVVPFGWEWQGTLFAALTLVAAWLWWRWLSRQVRAQKPADAALNQRGQQLVGKRQSRHLRRRAGIFVQTLTHPAHQQINRSLEQFGIAPLGEVKQLIAG